MWSIILHPGQTYHVEITTPIQLTNVSFGDEVNGSERSVVKALVGIDAEEEEDDTAAASSSETSSREIVIAALTPGQMETATTSVLLSNEIDFVVLSVSGPNAVHLVGHYSDTNSTSAGLKGVLMDSDSDDDASLDEDEEFLEEFKQLKEDREAYMTTEAYALEQDDPLEGLEGYVFKDKTYPPGETAFVDLALDDPSDDDAEYVEGDVSMMDSESSIEDLIDNSSDGEESEDEDRVAELVAEARAEFEELKRAKNFKRKSKMTTVRFETSFDTLSWDESPISTTLTSAVSTEISSQTKITRVRTERTFHLPADTPSPTNFFLGAGVAEYTMVYAHEAPGAAGHDASADYGGILYLNGAFTHDGTETTGSVVLAVLRGRFEGVAKAEWKVVGGSLRGDVASKYAAKGDGGYVSVGMEDSVAWFELEVKA
ncbi:hypothetical protein RQP46_003119 [Phenoliferia psychrophenolica]